MLEYKQTGNKDSDTIMFMLHGYGDDENSYIGLANDMKNHMDLDYNFYAIRAPENLDFGGFSWYFIPWEEKIDNDIIFRIQKEIEENVNKVTETINSIIQQNNFENKKLILLGFSQGSVLSFYLADKLNWDGIISISGYISEPDKIIEIVKRRNLKSSQGNESENSETEKQPILFLYDDNDQVVNESRTVGAVIGLRIKELFDRNKLPLEYRQTHYGHAIGPDALKYIDEYLQKIK